jgi:hypothetical protein
MPEEFPRPMTIDDMTDEQVAEVIANSKVMLKARRAARLEAAKAERAQKWQRDIYLPQLVRARERLDAALRPMQERRAAIQQAIECIDSGEVTEYALYPPRKKRAASTPVDETA